MFAMAAFEKVDYTGLLRLCLASPSQSAFETNGATIFFVSTTKIASLVDVSYVHMCICVYLPRYLPVRIF